MNYRKLRLYILLSTIAYHLDASAQNDNVLKKLPQFVPHSEVHTFYTSMNDVSVSTDEFKLNMNEWMGLNSQHELKFVRSEKDALGHTREIFQHYYLGEKVENEYILLHHKDNHLLLVNGQMTNTFNFDTIVPIETQIAVEAIRKFNHSEQIKKIYSDELIVGSLTIEGKRIIHPMKKIKVLMEKELLPKTYYIDANYHVLFVDDHMFDGNIPSQSLTYYKGTQNIIVDNYVGGGYNLHDESRKIHTYYGKYVNEVDDQNGYFIPYSEYRSESPNFTDEFTRSAVEVHWGMKWTYDYYKLIHQRDSYDNKGARIDNYNDINHDIYGGHGMNASAYDLGEFAFMIYGDGINQEGEEIMNPVVGVDVAGHEFTHLVINRNGLGGLVYQGESGAINESIADVFGTSVEMYSNVNPNWTIAEGIIKANPGFMRDMAHPNTTNMPDTYQGTFWFDTNSELDKGGVHYNSSVGNYWYYLLVNGGVGINDLGDEYQVHGIGIDHAQKIVYRALVTYLTPNSTYIDYYHATRQATIDLFGANSTNEWKGVNDAWYAVGIGKSNAFNYSSLSDGIAVFPNPAKNFIIVDSDQSLLQSVTLYDLTGKRVLHQSNLQKGENFITIDGIAPGIYIVKCINESFEIAKKIVIQ